MPNYTDDYNLRGLTKQAGEPPTGSRHELSISRPLLGSGTAQSARARWERRDESPLAYPLGSKRSRPGAGQGRNVERAMKMPQVVEPSNATAAQIKRAFKFHISGQTTTTSRRLPHMVDSGHSIVIRP